MGRDFARLVCQVFGVALLLSGGMWALQGAGLLQWPSDSFMIERREWAVYGAIAFLIGAALIWLSERLRR